jgi:hypothetical protein
MNVLLPLLGAFELKKKKEKKKKVLQLILSGIIKAENLWVSNKTNISHHIT